MVVNLRYGRGVLPVDLPAEGLHVVEPRFVPGLPDEAHAFHEAARSPVGARPLRECVKAGERLAVAIPDATRPLPSSRLLPWLFRELAQVAARDVTIVNGTGSHRPNTPEELRAMVGEHVLREYRVVNHSAHDPSGLALAGSSPEGQPVFMNREWVEADRRIVLGFVEPHFMAGFSGGYKGVFPALADIDSIMRYHRAEVIADPRSTWGCLEGNPTQEQVRANGSLRPVDFCVNVTLNRDGAITGFFCGDPVEAHRGGAAFVRESSMVPLPRRFPIVVTTNSGHPLDQNLYQAVKGMSAAALIVEEGGLILAAARCEDGFPDHGHFRRLVTGPPSPQAILDAILSPGFSVFDQWEAQVLAMVLVRARVALFSELAAGDVRAAHLEPVDDIARRVREERSRLGAAAVAVLPEGPMTIPYVAAPAHPTCFETRGPVRAAPAGARASNGDGGGA